MFKLKTQKILAYSHMSSVFISVVVTSHHIVIAVSLYSLFKIFLRIHWSAHLILKNSQVRTNRNSQSSSKILYIPVFMFCMIPLGSNTMVFEDTQKQKAGHKHTMRFRNCSWWCFCVSDAVLVFAFSIVDILNEIHFVMKSNSAKLVSFQIICFHMFVRVRESLF